MRLDTQLKYFLTFYMDRCVGAMKSRQHDYAPDGVVLLNVLETCVNRQIKPEQVLGVLLDKQLTAINHYRQHGHTNSESLASRAADAANYLVFLTMWEEKRREILDGWNEHWTAQPCTCELLVDDPTMRGLSCQRCNTVSWLDRYDV